LHGKAAIVRLRLPSAAPWSREDTKCSINNKNCLVDATAVDFWYPQDYDGAVPAIGICGRLSFSMVTICDVFDIIVVIILVSVGLLVMRSALDKPENLKRR